MKTELMNIPNKGVCLVISGLDFVDDKINITNLKNISQFSDVKAIAELIARNKKIGAIKEVRFQTGWGLKDSKRFIDDYLPMSNNFDVSDCVMSSKRFIRDHTLVDDFLDGDDFKI